MRQSIPCNPRNGFRGYGSVPQPKDSRVFAPWAIYDGVPVYSGNVVCVRLYERHWADVVRPERRGWELYGNVANVWTHPDLGPDVYAHQTFQTGRIGWVIGQRMRGAAPHRLDEAASLLLEDDELPASEVVLPLRLRIPVMGGDNDEQGYRGCNLRPMTTAPWRVFRHGPVPYEVGLVENRDRSGRAQVWVQAYLGGLFENAEGAIRRKLHLADGRCLAGLQHVDAEWILDDCVNTMISYLDVLYDTKQLVPAKSGGTCEPILGRIRFSQNSGLVLPVELPGCEPFEVWLARAY